MKRPVRLRKKMTIDKPLNKKGSKPAMASAEIVPRQGISVIWFIPFIALIFGGWLAIKAISEQGVFITIEFENGSGIVPKKTEVRYKGLVTGLVSKVEPSDDLKSVIAEVEMTQSFADYLTDNTKFWLVSADISLQGVSGLDTLVSGSYINILPDTAKQAKQQDRFVALSETPQLDMTTPGLHLTLQTNVLGSISENSPITFKQIPIGYVTSYHYVEESQNININIFIEQEYAHLIKENSLFWNMSGVQVTASLAAGLKIKTGSLGSILGGGIAVDTLSYQAKLPAAKNGNTFPLHADFQSAEMGHSIELTLDWNSEINHNAAILYQGVPIGTIESFSEIDPKTRKITAQAKVNPRVIPYLTEQSQFYLVSPRIDFAGVSNAQALLTGTYINIRPSLQGEPTNKFHVFNTKPPYLYSEPGLHLVIESNNKHSLQTGSNIYYKEQVIGSVQAIDTVDVDQHLIHVHIQEGSQHYVTPTSRFYNNSGLQVNASLRGIEVEAQSLQSMLTGGLSMVNLDNADNSSADDSIVNGDKFNLFANKKLAEQRVSFTLVVAAKEKINNNTRILYRGIEIGAIHTIESEGEQSKLSLGLLPEYEHILREDTQFWLVKPSLTLSGATDTEALLGGAYITFDFNKESDIEKTNFTLLTSPPAKPASAPGLQLSLLADSATVATAGSSISYRGIVVGQVDNVILDKETDKVHVNVTIDDEHKSLIQANTRFYNASGITLSGGLSGFVMKTESVDAILKGGISFYNPIALENTQTTMTVSELDAFELFDNFEQAENAGLAIQVYFHDYSGLKENTNVVYQGQVVGSITRLMFDYKKTGVTALVLLNDIGAKFAKNGTSFWVVEPEIGLVGSKNVSSLLEGAFISLLPSDKPNSEQQTVFEALELPPTVKQLPYGLNIKLVSKRLGSVRVGNPVLYRQVKVGEVIGIDLSSTADTVDIFINIAKRYAPLVNHGSKFWNTSGINIEAGVFSGININSESIETLISGGIAFASPALKTDVKENPELIKHFLLHQDLEQDWLEWQPKIAIGQ